MNSLLRLWDKYPSMFAVGLVCVAEKVDKSRFSRNAAVDHKKRTTEDEAVNVNTL